MFLSDLSIKQPVLATMLAVTLVVFGIYSYRELSVDLMPNVELPVLTVQTVYTGTSPETVEREVTRRVEEALNTIPGIDHISSTSTEGLSLVIAQFELGVSITTAQQDAQSKINAIRADFPRDIEEPVIQRLDINAQPIVSVAVESKTADIKSLSSLAEKVLKKRLENVSGVGQVNLIGLARREVQILVDREKLKSLGLTFAEVAGALQRENIEVPAGKLEQGVSEPLVRVSGKFDSVDEFRTLLLAFRGGRPIYLHEVARIEDGIEERRSSALVNDERALVMNIVRQSGSNTVEVADGVHAAVDQLNRELPSHIRLRIVVDSSAFIRDSVEDVKVTLLLGGLLTVLIVFVFLNSWRSTVITGLSLPVSVIATFIVMRALGFTLNILTLMGLSLAIGLLIDDAIVVRENIVRHMHAGVDHFTAAREATAEIGLAVLATSMTIVAVFVPVAFMGGIMGRFFYQFGITVGFAVLVSLYVSFTIDPMLSSRWYDPAADPRVRRKWFARLLARFNDQVDRLRDLLAATLGWSLRHRLTVVGVAVAAVVGSLFLFGQLGSGFMPNADEGNFLVTYRAEPGISMERSEQIARVLAADVRKDPGVAYTYTTVGGTSGEGLNQGSIYVSLKEPAGSRRYYLAIMADTRERMKRYPSLQTAVSLPSMGGAEAPIQISLRGDDLNQLRGYGRKLEALVANTAGSVDVDSSEVPPRPEFRIGLNRKIAGDLGLDLGTVATTVRSLVAGQVVSQFEDADGDSYDVRLRIDPSQRGRTEDLDEIYLPAQLGRAQIPLSQVAYVESAAAPSNIRRFDLMREIRVSANTQGRSLGEVVNEIKLKAAGLNLPAGYGILYTGEAEQMAESFGYVTQSLILAILLIYAILASQFRSFAQPLAIMFSLPLSLVGVGGMLYLVKDTLNMMSMIGVILLMGLVTKNAILLIDFTNVQRRAGAGRREALIEAARVRLRPILMTTLAMIFGMAPLAFELGAGAEFRAPMARAVIGGLITSTLLTLIVVPIVYTFLDDLGVLLARLWHRGTPAHALAASKASETAD